MRLRRTPLDAARRAYEAALRSSDVDLVEVADRWCDEAVRAGDNEQAAKAYWQRVVIAPVESARRVPLDHRLLPLISQRTVAEAGHRQLPVGRIEDAVRILEFGRGVLLRRAVGAITPRERDAIEQRGQGSLLDAYRKAVCDLGILIRAQYGRPKPAPTRTVVIGQRSYAVHGDDPLVAAHDRVEELEGRIARELGAESGPPKYADILSAAREIPLVYIAAATEGYALVVRRCGPPQHVRLPMLTGNDAQRYAGILVTRSGSGLPQRQVREAVEWLTNALGNLRSQLAKETALTLVPIGLLALLPLHAVFEQATRYAVSARAVSPVARPVRADSSVLVVSADGPWFPPETAGPPPLRLSEAQARLLANLHGERLEALVAAQADDVLDRLGGADICHLMCHGQADPARGLNSRLLFTDRPLSLAEIFARDPLHQRLVVLGACESSVPDQRMPDETISFPGALVQAGVEGVVAALWRVAEPAAALVLQRFHERIAAGDEPMAALDGARRWLRTATIGELRKCYPQLWRDRFSRDLASVPYAEPVHWAAFTYTGT